MLSNDFQKWCDGQSPRGAHRINLSQKTRQLIENIRSSEPSRSVNGRGNNVCGRYPSQKMGKTIQFESHRVEAPKIYELEQDENVLEYYDQPPPIKLNYQGKNDKKLGVIHTPDFFVLERDGAGWIECKTEEQLKKLEQKNPNRFCQDGQGNWLCPPGEEYAAQFGLSYAVCSDREFNWTLQRNFLFLEDYYRAKSLEIKESAKNSLMATVTEQAGITLSELLKAESDFNADDLYSAIANKDIYKVLDELVRESRNEILSECPKMLNDDFDIYGSCDLNKPSIPLRSSLYHLEPVGVGTSYVESLTSFLMRLAQAHSLEVNTLFTKKISNYFDQVYLREHRNKGLSTLFNKGAALNSNGILASQLYQSLEQLTLRKDLSCLTLLAFNNVFSSRKLLRKSKAWCPHCYEQWQKDGKTIHEPLLWSFETVTVCPQHFQPLANKCPHCDLSVPWLTGKSQVGFCPKCDRWLGNFLSNQYSTSESDLAMKEVAQRLKIDQRTIYSYFPNLCKAISAKYRSYQKQQTAERIQKCCQEVEQAVRSLHQAGEYPSEARVSQLISQPGYFRYKEVRKYLNRAILDLVI